MNGIWETFSYVGVALGDSWISPEDFVVSNRIVIPISLFFGTVVLNCICGYVANLYIAVKCRQMCP